METMKALSGASAWNGGSCDSFGNLRLTELKSFFGGLAGLTGQGLVQKVDRESQFADRFLKLDSLGRGLGVFFQDPVRRFQESGAVVDLKGLAEIKQLVLVVDRLFLLRQELFLVLGGSLVCRLDRFQLFHHCGHLGTKIEGLICLLQRGLDQPG